MIDLFRAFTQGGAQIKNLDLKDAFGNMDIVEQRNMVDGLLRGMLKQRLQKADRKFTDDVSTLLLCMHKTILELAKNMTIISSMVAYLPIIHCQNL